MNQKGVVHINFSSKKYNQMKNVSLNEQQFAFLKSACSLSDLVWLLLNSTALKRALFSVFTLDAV